MSSWSVCGSIWCRQMHQHMTSNRCTTGFKSGGKRASRWHQCLRNLGITYTLMRPGSVLHQEELRTHCICVRPDNRSEDFILAPNSSQGTVGCDTKVCVILQGYASPDHSWSTAKLVMLDDITGSMTFTSPQLLQTLLCLSRAQPANAWCVTVSTGPTRGYLGPHTTLMESVFDTGMSETCPSSLLEVIL